MSSVHERMELIRKSKGVTKTHIAKKCGYTPSWYTAISKGQRIPNADSIEKIAQALDVKPGVFFEEDLSVTLKQTTA